MSSSHSVQDAGALGAPVRAALPTRTLIQAIAAEPRWIMAWLVYAAYAVCIARLTSFPMQDFANHVARADTMADLLFHHGERFGRFFELHLTPVPYLLPDLLLTSAVEVFGVAVGAGIFTGLVLLSLPAALLLYARSCNLTPRARPFAFLLGLYLSTDWFFVTGFAAFRLALALVIVSLALAEMLRKHWTAARFSGYLVVIGLGYLTHLTAPFFMGVVLGTTALVRLAHGTTGVRREICLLAPVAAVLAWTFSAMAASHVDHASLNYDWAGPGSGAPWLRKLSNLRYEFIDFNWHVAMPTMLLFAACLVWPVRRQLRRLSPLAGPAVAELLAVAAAFLAVYWILPYEDRITLYVDVRALPMISLMLMLACLRLAPDESAFGNRRMLMVAALLAIAHLYLVAVPLDRNNSWINRYRAVAASVPSGAYVLPVHTETQLPHLLHASSHIVLDRAGVYPYLFSGNSGDPMTYFRYERPRYAPALQWYKAQLHGAKQTPDGAVDWNRIACDYDFLLVTMPFDAAFIRVPTRTVASNDAAALLAIDKHACRTAPSRPDSILAAQNAGAVGR